VKEPSLAGEPGKRINVVLDEEHAVKLQAMAARMYVQPGTIARSLLSTALDQVDSEASTITAVLDAIPGAWERTQDGLADAKAGRVVSLDDLEEPDLSGVLENIDSLPVPEGWKRTASGDPMPNVVAGLRRSRSGH
jgi:predicted transcriptional regulator